MLFVPGTRGISQRYGSGQRDRAFLGRWWSPVPQIHPELGKRACSGLVQEAVAAADYSSASPARKKIRATDAKEVGVEDPAEETYCRPNQSF